MHPLWIEKVAYPMYDRLHHLDVSAKIRELERLQREPAEAIREHQFRKLRALVRHCARNVPHYRPLLRHVDPADIRTAEDLAGLPELTKDVLRDHFHELCCGNRPQRLYHHRSSGSTGQPRQIFADRTTEGWRMAALFRSRKWWGWRLGAKTLELWGIFRPLTIRQRLFMRLVENRARLCTNYVTDHSVEKVFRAIREYRPDFLRGYVSSLYAVAQGFVEKGIDGRRLGLRAVCTTAELLEDSRRALIRSVFGCPVVNEYGASETGVIAFECPEGGMHRMDENLFVEFVPSDDPRAPAGTRQILVTDLNNRATPLLRYRIGDTGSDSPGTCGCGLNLGRMNVEIGRDVDYVPLKDGRTVVPIIFCHMGMNSILEFGPLLKQFQVHQLALDRFRVDLVVEPEHRPLLEKYTRETFSRHLGDFGTLEVEFRDRIPVDASGKLKYYVSHLRPGPEGGKAGEGP